MKILRMALVVAISLAIPSAASAQFDHLQCHKVKDTQKFKGTIVDLAALQQEFQLPSTCEIKGKAKKFCVPVGKTVVEPGDAPGSLIGPGNDLSPNDYVCYKVKCPKSSFSDTLVTDQFGERNLVKIKSPKELCVPAVKGVVSPECLADIDCDDNDACTSDVCSAGACQHSAEPPETLLPPELQTAGDCLDATCGGGQVPNDNDLPDDGNECTSDACTNGVPSSSPVPDGDLCAQGNGDTCCAGICIVGPGGPGVCVVSTTTSLPRGTTLPPLTTTTLCLPDCTGKQCGDNGCGGSCGNCDDGLTCTTDICEATGVCSAAIDGSWCVIDGSCWPQGQVNLANQCEHCDPTASQTVWTPRPDGSACSLGTCSGGVCVP
jgi:hypothetical protein